MLIPDSSSRLTSETTWGRLISSGLSLTRRTFARAAAGTYEASWRAVTMTLATALSFRS